MLKFNYSSNILNKAYIKIKLVFNINKFLRFYYSLKILNKAQIKIKFVININKFAIIINKLY